MDTLTILLRIIITFAAAFLYGMQRQKAHKPIGFGTFTFVAIGATALTMAAEITFPTNYLPLLSAVVTGIGFLGAGAIIRSNDKIFGATTAASIWLFAILGVVIGIGQFAIAAIMYGLIWLVIFYDMFLERRGLGSYQKKITITTNRFINEKEIKRHLFGASRKHNLLTIDIDKKNKKMVITYVLQGSKETINILSNQLHEQEWIDSYKVE